MHAHMYPSNVLSTAVCDTAKGTAITKSLNITHECPRICFLGAEALRPGQLKHLACEKAIGLYLEIWPQSNDDCLGCHLCGSENVRT